MTLNAETDAELHAARLAEEIFSTAEANEWLGEKLEFLKSFVSGTSDTGEEAAIINKVVEYDKKLDSYGIEPEHLSLAQFTPKGMVTQAMLQIWPLILFAPLSIVGAIIHYPAYKFCGVVADRFSKHGADDVASTVKVLAGMVFVPFTWLVTAGVVFYFLGWEFALLSLPIAAVCGYLAMYSQEEILELSGWARAIWIYLTRRETFLRMFIERRELQNQLKAFDSRDPA